MKKNIKQAQQSAPSAFRRHLNEFVVRPLAHLINRHSVSSIEQGKKILDKLTELDELIAIVAREVKNYNSRAK